MNAILISGPHELTCGAKIVWWKDDFVESWLLKLIKATFHFKLTYCMHDINNSQDLGGSGFLLSRDFLFVLWIWQIRPRSFNKCNAMQKIYTNAVLHMMTFMRYTLYKRKWVDDHNFRVCICSIWGWIATNLGIAQCAQFAQCSTRVASELVALPTTWGNLRNCVRVIQAETEIARFSDPIAFKNKWIGEPG